MLAARAWSWACAAPHTRIYRGLRRTCIAWRPRAHTPRPCMHVRCLVPMPGCMGVPAAPFSGAHDLPSTLPHAVPIATLPCRWRGCFWSALCCCPAWYAQPPQHSPPCRTSLPCRWRSCSWPARCCCHAWCHAASRMTTWLASRRAKVRAACGVEDGQKRGSTGAQG